MIDHVGRGGPARPPIAGAGQPARPGNAQAATPAPRANIGSAGHVVRTMAATPPVDTARVEALRSAIAAGTYEPDPEAIAARMIALEQGSGGR